MTEKKPYTAILLFAMLAITVMSGCKLQYSGEEFSLKIAKDGSAKLEVNYKNFGSDETKTYLRDGDMDILKDLVREDDQMLAAKKEGVTILARRLDFRENTTNGYVKAGADSAISLFKVFRNYTFEVKEKIFITPLNGIVKRATLSKGGKIVIVGDRYSFAWPLGTKDFSFTASYKTKGASFQYDARRRSGGE